MSDRVPQKQPPALLAPIVPGLFAGVISGTLIIFYAVTFAALMFAGQEVKSLLPAGIGILLASSFAIGAIVSSQSSFRPVISSPQDSTSVILGLITVAIARNLKPGAELLPTVVAAIGVTTLATGALFLFLGIFRLGKIVRFIPYPVVGGFLAGTGWLVLQAAFTVMMGVDVTFDQVPALLAPGALINWIPGLCFGLVLTVVLRRFHHFLLMPGLLGAGVAAFYLAVVVSGVGVAGAGDRHWLLGPFPKGGLWPPISPADLAHVDWTAVFANGGNIAACALLSGISLLFNATGLELATDEDVDLDRELRATGVANLIVGGLGGVPGYLSLGESTLNHKIGARSRAAGYISAGLCAVTLVAGTDSLAYFPKPVLGGLLCFLGFSFLLDNLYDTWFKLPRGEYALVLGILVVVVTVGFLAGVGAGIVVSSGLFALNYARIDVVKHAISGAGLRSKAGRSPGDESVLQALGGHVHVLQLQGYLFFGTAFQLLQRVQKRVLEKEPLPAHFVILDFRHVDGLDSSAVVSFARMRKLAEAHGATLIFTALPASVKKQLERGEVIVESSKAKVFIDLDHGLEWCEGQILAATAETRPSSEALARELEAVVEGHDLVTQLLGYLERVEAPAGYEVYRKGEASDDLYLIESGERAAGRARADGRSMRLRTMGAGSVVGESGLYLGQSRSASVRTTRPSVLYRLSTAALKRMTGQAPELAAAFHQFVVRLLAERMVNTTSAAQMLFY
jgi:SulP family sulfate permease